MVDASFVQIGASNISPHFIERGQEAFKNSYIFWFITNWLLLKTMAPFMWMR